MELFVELRDHNDILHNKFKSTFGNQVTLGEFQKKIYSKWGLQTEDQSLFFENGGDLDGLSELRIDSFGVKHGGRIIVKHNMLPSWQAFVENFKMAREALSSKQMSQMEEAVDQALTHLIPLIKTTFLLTYPNFDETYRKFKENFSKYMEQDFKYIELAVKDYFSRIFMDNPECPALTIMCEKKAPEEGGVQGGLICKVLENEETVRKFYVKEHMGIANWQHADIREIFTYKLLELIGVGPKVYFIPNVHYSSLGLYIGTAEVPGFQPADTEGIEISPEIYAQRDLVRRLLFVKDLHSKNFGIDDKGNLSIIDLQIKNSVDSEMIYKYLEGYQSWKGSRELRIRVAEECIEKWKLIDTLDEANEAISTQKELFKKHSISYKPSQNFDDYFSQVKDNLKALMKRLN